MWKIPIYVIPHTFKEHILVSQLACGLENRLESHVPIISGSPPRWRIWEPAVLIRYSVPYTPQTEVHVGVNVWSFAPSFSCVALGCPWSVASRVFFRQVHCTRLARNIHACLHSGRANEFRLWRILQGFSGRGYVIRSICMHCCLHLHSWPWLVYQISERCCIIQSCSLANNLAQPFAQLAAGTCSPV